MFGGSFFGQVPFASIPVISSGGFSHIAEDEARRCLAGNVNRRSASINMSRSSARISSVNQRDCGTTECEDTE